MLLPEVGNAPSVVSSRPNEDLARRLFTVRRHSQVLAGPLTAEDRCVQAMPDASPTKWHLAHTTWFFETFVLRPFAPDYRVFDDAYAYCFNSYYEQVGARHPRPMRGMLTRPSSDEVTAYRGHVDVALERFVASDVIDPEAARRIEIGIQHEQQHQELLLTDILALFALNPLRPAYRPHSASKIASVDAPGWVAFKGGLQMIGHEGEGFAFDNETPRHQALIRPFLLADRLVTNREWLRFMAEGGYGEPKYWLADGWARVQQEGWKAPEYFESRDGEWFVMGLSGAQRVDQNAPVTHVSYYEADAYARFAGKRLPSEFEWEVAACVNGLRQMFGACWQWTQSAYLPYPGFRATDDALGEYNGKFMVSQMVLRGGSCVTPDGHARPTYRNFFYPWQRWQFTGVRLADDAS
jgi:ergothioneine biosynthesis protein EgtB